MIDDIRQLTEQYHSWLREKTNLRSIEDWVEITTPYLDRHNDCIQIYVKRSNGGYLLTDDGATIDDLELSGCTISSPKRQSLFRTTINGFGIKLGSDKKALEVQTSIKDFALKKHNLLQAILAVNDLFYLATPMVASLFLEDLEAWLKISNIRFVPNIKMSGKSGYDHLYNFVVAGSTTLPERVLLSINNPNRASAHQAVFAWEDTRGARSGDSLAYVFLNDAMKSVSENILTAFQSYNMKPVKWTLRESVREELAA